METTTERINKAVAYLKGTQRIKEQKDIKIEMGVDKSTVSQALMGNEKYLTKNFIKKFCEVYPFFNIEWLKTGEGEMLITEQPKLAEKIEELRERLDQKDRHYADVIEILKERITELEGRLSKYEPINKKAIA